MCGIVGVIRPEWGLLDKDRTVFIQMLAVDSLRGIHGTGVLRVEEDGTHALVKIGGPPHPLLTSKEWNKFWADVVKEKTMCLIGHNRHATTGGISTATAHPFMDKHISMVHNGTLDKNLDLPDYKKYPVDSQALCHAISVLGIEETLAKTTGAYAIAYHDKIEKTINLIRNNERPLFVGMDETQGRVMFASEKEMLEWIMKRNWITGTGTKVIELPIDTLWSFKIGTKEMTEKKIKGKATGVYGGADMASWERTAEWWDRTTQIEVHNGPEDDIDKKLDKIFGPKAAKKARQVALDLSGGKLTQVETKQRRDPRLKEVYIATKHYSSQDYLQPTEEGNSQWLYAGDKTVEGARFLVTVRDYVPENREKQWYVIIAENEDFKDCRFQFRVEGNKKLDEFFNAMAVEVEFVNSLVPHADVQDQETVVWVKNPVAKSISRKVH